jgi:hypothetical protein
MVDWSVGCWVVWLVGWSSRPLAICYLPFADLLICPFAHLLFAICYLLFVICHDDPT